MKMNAMIMFAAVAFMVPLVEAASPGRGGGLPPQCEYCRGDRHRRTDELITPVIKKLVIQAGLGADYPLDIVSTITDFLPCSACDGTGWSKFDMDSDFDMEYTMSSDKDCTFDMGRPARSDQSGHKPDEDLDWYDSDELPAERKPVSELSIKELKIRLEILNDRSKTMDKEGTTCGREEYREVVRAWLGKTMKKGATREYINALSDGVINSYGAKKCAKCDGHGKPKISIKKPFTWHRLPRLVYHRKCNFCKGTGLVKLGAVCNYCINYLPRPDEKRKKKCSHCIGYGYKPECLIQCQPVSDTSSNVELSAPPVHCLRTHDPVGESLREDGKAFTVQDEALANLKVCRKCNGSGTQKKSLWCCCFNSNPGPCKQCMGVGLLRFQNVKCSTCHGLRKVRNRCSIKTKCPACQGYGLQKCEFFPVCTEPNPRRTDPSIVEVECKRNSSNSNVSGLV